MCLTCASSHNTIQGKDAFIQLFNQANIIADALSTLDNPVTAGALKKLSPYNKNLLHLPSGKSIQLTGEQIEEIIYNAAAIIATGVDTQIDIWAIQWKYDYISKTIILIDL